jgi:uncharacterized protein (TIGR03435 family)
MQCSRLSCILLVVIRTAISQGQPSLEFEVASVRPAASNTVGSTIQGLPGGRLNIRNMSLKEIIVVAWRIQPFQVAGAPAWLDSAHYDISAKSGDGANQSDLTLMLRALLVDRFHLKFHRETKELPIYSLVIAKKHGELGPGLTESTDRDCTTDPSSRSVVEARKLFGLQCGEMAAYGGQIRAVSIPLDRLTPRLSRLMDREVVNKTGLTANFNIHLEWTPERPQGDALSPPEVEGPSIFTAIQDQLGLKLESQKGPVDILVVDHVEKPSAN